MLWGCTKRSRNMIWLRRCRDTGHYLRKMLICIDLLGMRQPTILSCLVGATVKHAIFVQQDLGLSENPKSNGSSVPPSNFFLVNSTLFAKFDGKIPWFLSHTKHYETPGDSGNTCHNPKGQKSPKGMRGFFSIPFHFNFHYSLVKPPFFTFGGKMPFHDRYILMISTIFYHDFPQYFLYPSIATY